MREHRVGRFRPDDANEFFARGASHAGQAAKRHQQRLASPRSDSGDAVQLRSQIALSS